MQEVSTHMTSKEKKEGRYNEGNVAFPSFTALGSLMHTEHGENTLESILMKKFFTE